MGENNISECRLERVKMNIYRDNAFSLKETVEYQNYNTCTGQAIGDSYKLEQATRFSFMSLVYIFCVVISVYMQCLDSC